MRKKPTLTHKYMTQYTTIMLTTPSILINNSITQTLKQIQSDLHNCLLIDQ